MRRPKAYPYINEEPRMGGVLRLGKSGGVFALKFDFSLPKTPITQYKRCFLSLDQRYGEAYPRDVVAGVATQRGPALLLAARSGFARLGTTRLRSCSAGRLRLIKTSFCAAGSINVGLGPAAPVRLRRPYNKENYSPRALQRVDSVLVTDFARTRPWLLLKPLAARACS